MLSAKNIIALFVTVASLWAPLQCVAADTIAADAAQIESDASVRLAQQPYPSPPPPQFPQATGGEPPRQNVPLPPAVGGAMPQMNTPYPPIPGGALPQPYPSAPQSMPYPPPTPQAAPPLQQQSVGAGAVFVDAMGRFRATLPQGAIPLNTAYSFAVPSAGVQVSIMCNANDQDFQATIQSLPSMLQQMGVKADAPQAFNFRGRQAHMLTTSVFNPQTNTTLHSVNILIPGPNIWVQVSAPEQNKQHLPEVVQVVLDGLQY